MRKGAGIVGITFGAIFLLVGIFLGGIFAVIGGVIKNEGVSNEEIAKDLKKNGEKTTGVVVLVDDGTTVEYEDEDGEEYRITYNMTSSTIREGDRLTVYYDERHPSAAIVPEIAVDFNLTFGNIFFWVGIGVLAIFGGIGLVAIIVSIVMLCKKDNPEDAKKQQEATERAVRTEFVNAANSFGKSEPIVTNDIPVNVTVSNKNDFSGIDKKTFE